MAQNRKNHIDNINPKQLIAPRIRKIQKIEQTDDYDITLWN